MGDADAVRFMLRAEVRCSGQTVISSGSDLTEAHNAFELAIQIEESDSTLPDPGLALVAYGAVA